MPRDASVNGDGFRFYRFEPSQDPEQQVIMEALGLTRAQRTTTTDVLSVTSIRTLAGEPWQLVNWKIANVVNLAMGVRKQTRIGPRGGVREVYVKDGPFPGEFVTRMMATRGSEDKLDIERKWLREQADEPLDVAAVRGTVVHKLIEVNAPLARLTPDGIVARFQDQWKHEKRKVRAEVTDEDIHFVYNAMRQYWHMRETIPFVILAQEPQVWNLEAGYAGSADVLIWFLGHWKGDVFTPLPGVGPADVLKWQALADKGLVTVETIAEVGGEIALGDWKTSKSVYTNHVVQGTAYLAAQFVGGGGKVDLRLTELLLAMMKGMLVHIRPNGWEVDFFEMDELTLQAFLGSVAFARFLALHSKPYGLFSGSIKGTAPETDDSIEVDDNAA